MRNEQVCEKCGVANPNWFATEFVALVGSRRGIFCPTCFMALDDTPGTWMVTRLTNDYNEAHLLADVLRGCIFDPGDADRLARCIIDAGWRSPQDRASLEWQADNLAAALRRTERERDDLRKGSLAP